MLQILQDKSTRILEVKQNNNRPGRGGNIFAARRGGAR
jgi:hypothetical protein